MKYIFAKSSIMESIEKCTHPERTLFMNVFSHTTLSKLKRTGFITLLSLCLYFNDGIAGGFNYSNGFDPQECEEILSLNFAFLDTSHTNTFPDFLDLYYRSNSVGLDNTADIWLRDDSVIVIMLRGTTSKMESILADFYCSMMSAKGKLALGKGKTFEYQLASDERAAVHTGFLIGFAYLADDIKSKIDSLYENGYRNFIVGGHSQGGALCYYMSAWLMQLRDDNTYRDIQVKTYASASPKMGNIYFAYDYDNATRSQWSFSIVNTADPVPEMPFTTQQVDIDMNEPNPILNLMKRFDDLPFLKRIILKSAFNKMRKRARRSSEAYQRYLGRHVGSFIKKSLPEMILPDPVKTTYFVRPGVPIILSVNKTYWDYYKNGPRYFHHGIDPYRFLLRQYYEGLSSFKPIANEP